MAGPELAARMRSRRREEASGSEIWCLRRQDGCGRVAQDRTKMTGERTESGWGGMGGDGQKESGKGKEKGGVG